jgi:hypothetical protein
MLPRLKSFSIANSSVGDTAPLVALTQCHFVNLRQTDIVDLRSLANLNKLREIYLYDCPSQLDLSPLAGLPQRLKIRLTRRQPVQGLDAVRGRHRIIRE